MTIHHQKRKNHQKFTHRLYMSWKILYLIIGMLFIFPDVICFAQEAAIPNVAILMLEVSGGVPASYTQALTDRLRQEIFQTGAFKVMERGEMDEILKEIGFQQAGCTSNECVVRAGRILGVQYMVAGSVSRMGEIHTITARLIDVQTSEIKKIESVDCVCSIEEVLTSKLKLVAQKLAGQESGAKISTSEMMGVGNVKISSSPSGAKIYLDDKLSESTTPTTLRGLSSGQHNIRLEKGNLVGSKQVFVLPDMTSDVKVNLEPGYGSISITSKPSGGEISLDGSAIGTTPLKLDTIASGDHTVKIVCAGYTDYEETIHIDLNQFLNLNVVMKEFGGLLIESQPSGCKVYYEGEALGVTPLLWEQRPAGESLLRLKYPGFRKLETRVTVKAAKLDTVRLILEPKYRSAGLVMSAFLPGSGQIYSGKPFKGLTFLALQIGSGYLAYNFAQEHKNKVGLYDEARMEYISAVYPGEIESARRLMDESYDETVKYQHLRDGFLAAAGAVYLYNIVDIMFINKFPANVPVPSGWQMSSYGESDEVGLKVSYGF